MPHLTYSIEQRVATLTLNNPPQNRIGEQLVNELADALNAVTRSDARSVLLRSEGPRLQFRWRHHDLARR